MTRPVEQRIGPSAGARRGRPHALFMASRGIAVLGLLVLGVAGWMRFGHRAEEGEADAATAAALTDAGDSIRDGIERTVGPAIERTGKLTRDPMLIGALQSGDQARLTRVANEAIASSTEIDAIAIFDLSGRIVAVNTIYASGQPIPPERVDRIMGMSFDGREIIQRCIRNELDDAVLEFQTTCDITPAFFDSSGLSVAYSAPVRDPASGKKVGVVSSRLRFERLSRLLEGRTIGAGQRAAYLVGDRGEYFSEAINRGSSEPPLATEIVRSMISDPGREGADPSYTRRGNWYVSLFNVHAVNTLRNGGIHVLLLVDQQWAHASGFASRRLLAGMVGAIGALLVVLGAAGELAIRLFLQHRRLLRESERAEAASIAKSNFLANMSHEIRTPMTSIIGFSELLDDPGISDAERSGAIATIRASGDHLLRLINDILDLSKIEAGELGFEQLDVSPAGILTEVVSMMKIKATEKSVALELEIGSPMPVSIRTDPTRFKQSVMNLISNAIKFTELGTVRVNLAYDPRDASLVVTVADSGVGMNPEQLARLFRPFCQGDESTSRKYGGTGLGLSITKHIAESLGGTVEVQTRIGKGSTFTLTIHAPGAVFRDACDEATQGGTSEAPVIGRTIVQGATTPVPAVAAATPQETARAAPATLARPVPPVVPAQRLHAKVLLVEDGIDNQRLLSMILGKAGASVEVAENGMVGADRAWTELAAGSPFDVLLMDMQMPVMDGYQATALLRKRGYTGPIIALTAHAMPGDAEKCRAAGCDGFLTKPVDRAVLIREIEQRTARMGLAA